MREKKNRYEPQARYDAQHTTQIRLKLNLTTDADILERLDEVGNRQGYIKALIRADMEKMRIHGKGILRDGILDQ